MAGSIARASAFQLDREAYGRTLAWCCAHSAMTLLILLATMALTIYLFIQVPKGFFPQQDTGRSTGQSRPIRTLRSSPWTRPCCR